jgi:hypothetical protein
MPCRAVDDIGCQMRIQSRAALRTNIRAMINRLVGGVVQRAVVTLMTRLGSARPGLLSACLFVSRRRLRGRLRRLGWALQFQHDLYKLLLAQPFKGISIHSSIDSEITKPRKRG